MSIVENIARIRAQMNAAALACGRDPKQIQLCAATKMNGADAVREAIAGGVDCCGENRVQELVAKEKENAYEGRPVHFIGVLYGYGSREELEAAGATVIVDNLEGLLAAIKQLLP